MANVRYQSLKRPQDLMEGEEWPTTRTSFKVLFGAAFALLIVIYHLSPGELLPGQVAPNRSAITSKPQSISSVRGNSGKVKLVVNLFVNTTRCRMPAPDPFAADVLDIYKRVAYKPCAKDKALVEVAYAQGRYTLHLNEANVACCYKQILRAGAGATADTQYELLPCSSFQQDFVVPLHVAGVITECRRMGDKKLLQQDAFGFVHAGQRTGDGAPTEAAHRPSVLLWGIDSLSRMNFQRTMPQMYAYLREENWFELQGYNKMGDNTYPNLMALLTGFNATRSLSVCQPIKVGGLDACPMVWKRYKEKGYSTAYGEDWSHYSTFNYIYRGFRQPPTDYYARPLILAAENELAKQWDTQIPFCVGRRHLAEYIYDAALQFTEVYRNESSFGMFWTNSFSHNNFALPSAMDGRMLEYMRSLQRRGVFERSIVLFFSDHGMRFGLLRQLKNGFLEERMPIMYIWLPKWFRQTYPEFAQGLQLNRNRLTSPYDIYATLRHILELDTPRAQLPRPEGCARCHSLFYGVDESRDCQDAGIEEHWCTCFEFVELPPASPQAKLIAAQLVEATNSYLAGKNLTGICHKLQLHKVESVQRKILAGPAPASYFLARYVTQPAQALFEATAEWNETSETIAVSVPSISRMTTFREHSACVADAVAKKYCICMK